ncbi:MAG: hypothetical protein KTR32_11050 [Granulosicoccus sp.]|nr:hypothetical protein [Granulosicoccus sp.]
MHQSLQKAVTRVLRPLARLLLRYGVSHAEFSNWAKQAYIHEAEANFGIDGKPPTVSRIAIVTGINRKEVKRIRELPDDVDTGVSKHNRAIRVVTGWLQDKQFLDSRKKPKVLTFGEPDDSFNQLVKLHGGDVPARAMLDELVRVGTVENNDGAVKLLQKGYVPKHSESAMLDIFSTSASDLLNTLDHNLAHPEQSRLQMSVAYDSVSSKGVAEFKKISTDQAMKLLRSLDQKLSEFDHDANPDAHGDGSFRVGLGVYFIDDVVKESESDD